MASQSLQLVEGIAKVRLRGDLIAVPDFFQARREQGKRPLSGHQRLRQDQLGLGERTKIFTRGLCAVRGQRAEVLKTGDAGPVGAVNGHAMVAASGRFARGKHPLLPGPRGNGRSLQGHFLSSGCAKPAAEYPVGNEDGRSADANPQQSVPKRSLTTNSAKDADQRVHEYFVDPRTEFLPPSLLLCMSVFGAG